MVDWLASITTEIGIKGIWVKYVLIYKTLCKAKVVRISFWQNSYEYIMPLLHKCLVKCIRQYTVPAMQHQVKLHSQE